MKKLKSIGIAVFALFCIGVVVFFVVRKNPVEPEREEVVEEIIQTDTLRLIFVGDVMVHSTQYNAAWYEGKDSTYNFYPVFEYVKDYFSYADLALGNLEVPFGGKPYSGYPMFSSPTQIADDLKRAGFDLFFTANNHVADKGKKGLEGTIDHLSSIKMLHTGSFKDSLEKQNNYPLLVETGNFKLSFLNYTYGTNGMPVYKPNLVNLIDTIEIVKDIEKAKRQNPDYIIACVHWGEEYQNKENQVQREIALFMAENGVDLIVGAHPHVVQSFEQIITQKGDTVPVIYSLGNFISNQQWRYSDGGIAFEVALSKTGDQTEILSLAYEPLWVNRFNDSVRQIYRLIPVNDYYRDSTTYQLKEDQLVKMKLFYEDTRKKLDNLDYSSYFRKQ